MAPTNFAKILEIHSIAAAVVFAVLYAPLLLVFFVKVLRGWTWTRIVLTLFCQVRIVAFILRAVLAGSTSAGENESLFIAYSVLYNAGFYWVLNSAYSLVIDRENIRGGVSAQPEGPFSILTFIIRQRRVVHIILLAALGLGITGAIESTSTDANTRSRGQTLREASVYIFLVVTILLAIHAVLLAIGAMNSQRSGLRVPTSQQPDLGQDLDATRLGARYDIHILAVIATLFLAREAFFAGTSHDFKTQNREAIWYPLAALTEYLALCLFTVPGLLPTRAQLKAAKA
ncbi:hypothetical protein PUNSTDRAFT_87184 [Punctularia strigosozonata HHB-11173 SS5]|uniref:uncharacterized protein n=1 Tax=Punctularia strigosozonata (strain HHB-11173) TaxID=741275 RepID=UPI00044171F5|nr:uncharacterized protein PUNSTDRAFT_87184 [Punctularia strigosozonata HHB-11173 SS5]EIN09068.1 hypothetical protein PUNSTDRAFT_87184 [Punctularia strigosozonata HHB-11173 SS5]